MRARCLVEVALAVLVLIAAEGCDQSREKDSQATSASSPGPVAYLLAAAQQEQAEQFPALDRSQPLPPLQDFWGKPVLNGRGGYFALTEPTAYCGETAGTTLVRQCMLSAALTASQVCEVCSNICAKDRYAEFRRVGDCLLQAFERDTNVCEICRNACSCAE